MFKSFWMSCLFFSSAMYILSHCSSNIVHLSHCLLSGVYLSNRLFSCRILSMLISMNRVSMDTCVLVEASLAELLQTISESRSRCIRKSWLVFRIISRYFILSMINHYNWSCCGILIPCIWNFYLSYSQPSDDPVGAIIWNSEHGRPWYCAHTNFFACKCSLYVG